MKLSFFVLLAAFALLVCCASAGRSGMMEAMMKGQDTENTMERMRDGDYHGDYHMKDGQVPAANCSGECTDDSDCSNYDRNIEAPYFCNSSGRCEKGRYAAPGENCIGDGITCRFSFCNTVNGVCENYKSPGCACDPTESPSSCNTFSYCDEDTKRCELYPDNGDTCDEQTASYCPGMCQFPQGSTTPLILSKRIVVENENGTCVKSKEGEPCTSSRGCVSGLYCDRTTDVCMNKNMRCNDSDIGYCPPRSAKGQEGICESVYDGEFNLVRNGYCAYPQGKNDGEECDPSAFECADPKSMCLRVMNSSRSENSTKSSSMGKSMNSSTGYRCMKVENGRNCTDDSDCNFYQQCECNNKGYATCQSPLANKNCSKEYSALRACELSCFAIVAVQGVQAANCQQYCARELGDFYCCNPAAIDLAIGFISGGTCYNNYTDTNCTTRPTMRPSHDDSCDSDSDSSSDEDDHKHTTTTKHPDYNVTTTTTTTTREPERTTTTSTKSAQVTSTKAAGNPCVVTSASSCNTTGGFIIIYGVGFGNNAAVIIVKIDNIQCTEVSIYQADTAIKCRIGAGTGKGKRVSVWVNGVPNSDQNTCFSRGAPTIESATVEGSLLYLSGYNFGTDMSLATIVIAEFQCTIKTCSETMITCDVEGVIVNIPKQHTIDFEVKVVITLDGQSAESMMEIPGLTDKNTLVNSSSSLNPAFALFGLVTLLKVIAEIMFFRQN